MENETETTQQQTSLEEAFEVCGENLNNPTTLQSYENIFLGDASPSAAKWRASEVLIAAMAANSEVFTGNILSTYFECGAISTNIVGTPYEIAIGSPNEKFEVGIDPEGDAYKAYGRLFPGPIDRLLNMPRQVIIEALQESSKSDPYALQERVNNTMRDQNAVDVRIINLAGSKITRYISTLPATIFSTVNGQSFPEKSIADGQLMVECASQLIFGTKAERFKVIRGIDMAGKTTLSQMKEVFAKQMGKPDDVAMSCICPECTFQSQDGEQQVHVLTYGGEIYKNQGTYMDAKKAKPKCTQMKNIVNANLGELPVRDLILAGFRPRGVFLYLLEGTLNSQGNSASVMREYSKPKGTVKMNARLWNRKFGLSPSIYVTRGDRDATGYELLIFMAKGGTEAIKQFVEQVPMLADGKVYKFDLETGEAEIKT